LSQDGAELTAALDRVVKVLRSHRVERFALTGGVAVGIWAAPRQTADIDVCGALPADEVNRLLAVREWLPAEESSFLGSVATASDEDLLRRLLG
jgi:hypothetical protein